MSEVSDGTKQNTKKLRFTLLSAFFNYIKNSIEPDFQNPCDNPALRKLFRAGKPAQFKLSMPIIVYYSDSLNFLKKPDTWVNTLN
jgi:hypothetical protein